MYYAPLFPSIFILHTESEKALKFYINLCISEYKISHNQIFRDIYRQLTGEEIRKTEEASFVPHATYLEGIKKALFDELKAVEKYCAIHKGLIPDNQRNRLFKIIIEEQKHATLYNYIYTRNALLKIA